MNEDSGNENKKFKIYLRGDVEDACTLPFEEYKRKTVDRWKRGENVFVETEEVKDD